METNPPVVSNAHFRRSVATPEPDRGLIGNPPRLDFAIELVADRRKWGQGLALEFLLGMDELI